LQGILASKTGLKKTAPDALKEIHKNVHAFFDKKGINALNFALRFVANSVSIDYFLFGVDNKEQLDQILAIDFQGYQYDGELDQLISSIDKNWLDPRKWN
jgi:predicted aldo/keto reductase-like oxidoreductase